MSKLKPIPKKSTEAIKFVQVEVPIVQQILCQAVSSKFLPVISLKIYIALATDVIEVLLDAGAAGWLRGQSIKGLWPGQPRAHRNAERNSERR